MVNNGWLFKLEVMMPFEQLLDLKQHLPPSAFVYEWAEWFQYPTIHMALMEIRTNDARDIIIIGKLVEEMK